MRNLWLAAIFAAIAFPTEAASIEAPLEPALHGKVQCYAPNMARKTCLGISSYRLDGDGALEVISTTLVGLAPEIITETTSSVEIKEGRVCGIFRLRDIAQADFTLDGKPAGNQQTYMLRDKIEESLHVYANREACTTYLPEGSVFKAKSSFDGVAQPKLDQVVIWVSPGDGFRVGQSR